GITHGPHPRDYHQKVNKKVRRLALKSALSLKVSEGSLVLLDSIDIEKPSTKVMASFLSEIDAGKKVLIMVGESSPAIYKSASNIPGTMVLHVDSINVYDILNHNRMVLTMDAARKIEEVYGA
ncbi:MAG: 50S ribosomal protein L4, partial [Thermovirgaceae bacterium]